MSEWQTRRFWTDAEVTETENGFGVTLDARPLRTPGRSVFALPSRVLAEAVAGEWRAQGDRIDPATMPFTRMANSAIDKVAPQFVEVAEMIAEYGGTDLLCYRADGPAALAARQAAAWDPLLDWARESLAAPLDTGTGIVHVAQPAASLARLREAVFALSPFQLVALHDLVLLSGSLVLALATARGEVAPPRAWALSRIDEDWQAAQWGADAEAMQAAALKRQSFLEAKQFFDLAR